MTPDYTGLLSFVAGNVDSGWIRSAPGLGLRCMLCNYNFDHRRNLTWRLGDEMAAHGRAHIEAVGSQRCEAAFALMGMDYTQQDAVREVFGFFPGSKAAIEFWREHGV